MKVDSAEKSEQHATIQKRTVQDVHHLHVTAFAFRAARKLASEVGRDVAALRHGEQIH
jgi:hypothetical protein